MDRVYLRALEWGTTGETDNKWRRYETTHFKLKIWTSALWLETK